MVVVLLCHGCCFTLCRYCPAAAGAPVIATTGYFTTLETTTTNSTRTGQQSCVAGEYCMGGIRFKCAAGNYSTALARSTPCDTLCPPGTWSIRYLVLRYLLLYLLLVHLLVLRRIATKTGCRRDLVLAVYMIVYFHVHAPRLLLPNWHRLAIAAVSLAVVVLPAGITSSRECHSRVLHRRRVGWPVR